MAEKRPSVRELLSLTKLRRRGGIKCWAANLEGDAKLFVEGCQKKYEAHEPFSVTEACRLAQKWYGIKIKRAAFSTHIQKRCCCYDNNESKKD